MVGRIEEVLKEIKNMDMQNKVGAAFGSYGWSGEAVEVINDYLEETKIKLLDSSYMIKATGMNNISLPVRVKFNPDLEDERIKSIAHAIGETIIG
jgi:flavorubredoxin